MKLSDLEAKLSRNGEARSSKELGTRSIELDKNEVVHALSRDGELANRKIDELPEKIRKELGNFFKKDFWRKSEVSNG